MRISFQSEKVNAIIADDYPLFRIGLSEVVRKTLLVNEIDEASNGHEVLALLQKKKYRVVFMDYEMPELNGEITTRLVSEKYPDTSVIALSRHCDIFTMSRMFNAGCKAYLIKNSGKEDVTNALEKILKGKKYFSNEVLEKLNFNSDDKNFEKLQKQFALTASEMKLIHLICCGKMNKQIAEEMNISIRTVEKYRMGAFHKAGVKNGVELIRFAVRYNIISTDHF